MAGAFQSRTAHSRRFRPSSTHRRARRARSARPTPRAARFRADVEILEIDPVMPLEGRDAVEPKGEPHPLRPDFRDVAKGPRLGREQHRFHAGDGDHHRVEQLFVFGEFADKAVDDGRVFRNSRPYGDGDRFLRAILTCPLRARHESRKILYVSGVSACGLWVSVWPSLSFWPARRRQGPSPPLRRCPRKPEPRAWPPRQVSSPRRVSTATSPTRASSAKAGQDNALRAGLHRK
jgi:hypothetical protein